MIIGISGKIGSGKDLIGNIIRFLVQYERIKKEGFLTDQSVYQEYLDWTRVNDLEYENDWKIKKVADKLKDIVCLLLGCTREQLEDIEFKNKELGEEWTYYYVNQKNKNIPPLFYGIYSTKEEVEKKLEHFGKEYYCQKTILTPRLILQLLGTKGMRDIIHPNVHVNALFADYKFKGLQSKIDFFKFKGVEDFNNLKKSDRKTYEVLKEEFFKDVVRPYNSRWIITDIRFPNEAKAVKDRDGILIRVNRFYKTQKNLVKSRLGGYINPEGPTDNHLSETALDDYKHWDYIVDNNDSIEDLIVKVKEILIKEKII